MRILDRLRVRRRRQGEGARLGEAGDTESVPLRLAASEMRAPALALLGHAQCLLGAPAEGAAHAEAVAAIAGEMLDLADELDDQATRPRECRVLVTERLVLGGLIEDVVEAVGRSLAPGRRLFRIAPALAAMALEADRRALCQVLSRVLTGAARRTRDGEWIDIGPEQQPGLLALVVADEGAGIADLRGGSADRRGLALGLAMARALMEAHGGSLAVEALPRVGTRVTLCFPAERLATGAEPGLAEGPAWQQHRRRARH